MKLSLKELTGIVTSHLVKEKSGNTTYTPSFNDWTGAIDKIGKFVELTDDFEDEAPELEGEALPFGKKIEEIHEDLILPYNHDPNGAGALTPATSTFRPASWSYPLEEQTFKKTIKRNFFEASCQTAGDFATTLANHAKSMVDSRVLYRNQCKRQLLGNAIAKIIEQRTTASTYTASTVYPIGKTLQSTSSSKVYGIVVKAITSASYALYNTWDDNVRNGFIIPLLNIVYLPRPTDTASGENYLQKIKDLSEVAGAESEGYSNNGNTMGAKKAGSLNLYQKFGIQSILDVQVKAGTIQLDQLNLAVNTIARKNFGTIKVGATDYTDKVYAFLIDPRGIKLHNNYMNSASEINADGDFENDFFHEQDTPFISNNTFATVIMEE